MASISVSRRKVLVAVSAVVVLAVAVLIIVNRVAQSQNEASGLPVTITNATDSGEPVYLYVIATDNSHTDGDRLGWVDESGSFHLWPKTSGSEPQAAPDVAISGPGRGASRSLALPANVSGRIYYSIGHKLDFSLVGAADGTTGLIQPAPWNSSDANRNTQFDWTEFTYTGNGKSGAGLWVNPTQVDQLAIPATVSVTAGNGTTATTGALRAGGGQQVIDTLAADPVWAPTVVRNSAGSVLRVLAPGHATQAGLLPGSYLDDYISTAWSAYTTKTLTVVPSSDQPSVQFFGHTAGDVMTFTDTHGATVASFEKPSSADVWGCDGKLNGVGNATLPNDQTTGPIARTLCAALTRGTLGSSATEPVSDPAGHYTNTSGLNRYAKAVHAAMADAKAYAFPFDDVGNQESLVSQQDPTRMTITLGSLTGSSSAAAGSASAASSASGASASRTPEASTSSATSSSTAVSSSASDTPAAGSEVVAVTVPADAPGWATLTLGAGTGPGIVTVQVEGGSTSTAAVDGAGSVRVDLAAPAGSHQVSISSTGPLGPASIALP
ncbi:MAG: beta-1,3-glucanase family protein [Propionibacterium sp.]